jgi:Xaa-Pro aminopeptidase
MKTVVSDPYGFFADGGWSFLAAESDSEGSDEEEESAFELSDSELAADESSEEDSEYDEDASADGSEEEFSGDEESGEDWDELEKKAKRQDKEARMDEDDRGTKRKR